MLKHVMWVLWSPVQLLLRVIPIQLALSRKIFTNTQDSLRYHRDIVAFRELQSRREAAGTGLAPSVLPAWIVKNWSAELLAVGWAFKPLIQTPKTSAAWRQQTGRSHNYCEPRGSCVCALVECWCLIWKALEFRCAHTDWFYQPPSASLIFHLIRCWNSKTEKPCAECSTTYTFFEFCWKWIRPCLCNEMNHAGGRSALRCLFTLLSPAGSKVSPWHCLISSLSKSVFVWSSHL